MIKVFRCQHWCQCKRDYQGNQYADRYRNAEFFEKLTDHAAHHADRQKYGDKSKRGRHDRETDFRRAVKGGGFFVLAHGQMTDNVLDNDDRVIDQQADSQ